MEASWAVVELMGHVKLAGRLTEEEHFGAKMGRLDIPDDVDPAVFTTRFFGGASVYSITVVTEEVARAVAKRSSSVAPIQPWEMPKQLTGTPVVRHDDYEIDDGEIDDEPNF